MAFEIWKPPVLFRFSVVFLWSYDWASASFAEVDGLSQELELSESKPRMNLASEVKMSDIVLKRALEPLGEKITLWIENTFQFLYGVKIKPCILMISLLDEHGLTAASWMCDRAFPIKWSADPLKASESRLASESITLRCDSIRRIF